MGGMAAQPAAHNEKPCVCFGDCAGSLGEAWRARRLQHFQQPTGLVFALAPLRFWAFRVLLQQRVELALMRVR